MQQGFRTGLSDDAKETPFPLAERLKGLEFFRRHGQDVALLRLVAPQLHRREPRFIRRDGVDVESRPKVRIVNEFRERIREPSRADVMD